MRTFVVALQLSMAMYGQVSFNRDVRPILSDRCFGCHGPDAASRNIRLRLDSEAASRPAVAGEQSELVRRITSDQPAVHMPPPYSGLKLSAAEIEILKAWVAQGAPWEKHWSFLPPVRPTPPAKGNAIDAFVRAALAKQGWTQNPEADRTTMIRRVTLDLTGVPPTPAEVDAFLADTAPNAYEKVVDRLLASPRYGEKMAIRWLDAARYADTNGYQTDAERHMWRWRDWVIGAFNSNMPFDRFALEQIAGDLLPNGTLEQRIATGFNRNHRGNSEGGIVPEEYLAEYAVDRVETMSTAFLGVTLGCARCHNHKYDPFLQKEFYQVFAYFDSIPELGRYLKYGNTPPTVKAPTAEQAKHLAALQRDVSLAQEKWKASEPEVELAQLAWEKSQKSRPDWMPEKGLAAVAPGGVFDGKRIDDAGDKAAFGFYSKFTVAAWIEPRTQSGAIVTRAGMKDDSPGWGLYLTDGKLQANLVQRRLDDSIRIETAKPIVAGRHHVAMTYDGSRMATGVRIYVDGKSQPLTILVDAINQDFLTKEPLRIGGGGGFTPPFEGRIENVRAYSRAMAQEDVAMLAGAGEERRMRLAFLALAADARLRGVWNELETAREQYATALDGIQTVMVMEELPTQKPTFILQRGAYDRPGERVSRGVPAALGALPEGSEPNRLGLAKWLTSRSNPLTARVAVNRFWQMYFGTGIVKTVEDFGSQGDWPSNPALLDWLAVEFMDSGWNVKQLQKTIVMSATYRQSSAMRDFDPENRMLARAPRLRLSAEVVRDQALAVSGLLVEKIGGPSVHPYQPAGLWSELGGADYQPDTGEGLYRRSLYTFWKRTAPPPFMANFDSALRESCTVRENRTDTPLQALNLMNDVQFVEAARALAQRTLLEKAPEARLGFAFRLVLARHPNKGEFEKLNGTREFYLRHFDEQPLLAKKLIHMGASKPDASLPQAELAAWTAVCSLILNLDEAVTKE